VEQHDEGFNRALKQVAFLFLHLDLSTCSVDKDVVDGQLVDLVSDD
jgi:hypothetical protein